MDCLGLRVPGHYIWVTRKIGTVGGEMHTTDAMVGKPSGTPAERFGRARRPSPALQTFIAQLG